MNLVYICRKCNLLGGQSRIAWELAREALQRGHKVHLVARRFPRVSTPGSAGESIAFHRAFQLPKFVGTWRFRSFAHFSSGLAERWAGPMGVTHGFGDSYRQDIITLGNVDWAHPSRIPGRRADPTAVLVKTRSFLDPGLRFLVAVSKQMRKDVLDYVPSLDPNKVKVIYPGIDRSRFLPEKREEVRRALASTFGMDPSLTWIVFAAGGDFQKRNIATLEKALLRLNKRNDWAFLFVGAQEGTVSWARELKGRTHFLGQMKDIGEVLPGCDLLAYPAWFDESPLVCLESMASGLPLVLSRTVGSSEIVCPTNRDVAIVNEPGDAEEVASAVARLLDNAGLRRQVGCENARLAEAFAWPKIYEQYETLYREVEQMKKKERETNQR